jgi:hypothetical protein
MKTNRICDESITAGNSRLASCGVKCLNSSAIFQINFSAGLTVLCSEIPHERQAQKRWQQAKHFPKRAYQKIKTTFFNNYC